jgi:hypothetical protein
MMMPPPLTAEERSQAKGYAVFSLIQAVVIISLIRVTPAILEKVGMQ